MTDRARRLTSFFRLGFLLPGCCVSIAAFAAESLKIPLHTDKVLLDARQIQDSESFFVFRQLHCQMVRLKHREPVLDALESVTQESPKRLLLKVREGAKFSDGSPVTSHDIVSSLDVLRDSRKMTRDFGYYLEKMDKLDDRKVRLELKEVAPHFIQMLASPNVVILKRSFIEQVRKGEADWAQAVGCGAYKVSQQSKEWIELSPVNGISARKIEFRLVGSARDQKLDPKNYDLIGSPLAEQMIAQNKGVEEFRVEKFFDPRQVFLGVNTGLERWRFKENRCDLLRNIQLEGIKKAYGDQGEGTFSLFPRGTLGYQARTSPFISGKQGTGHRFEQIKLLFLGLSVPEEMRPAYVQAVQSASQRVSSEILSDPKSFSEAFRRSGNDVFIFSQGSSYLDGFDYFLNTLAVDSLNFTALSESKITEEILSAQRETDLNLKASAYQKAEEAIQKECVVLPAISLPFRQMLVKKDLKIPFLGQSTIQEIALSEVK